MADDKVPIIVARLRKHLPFLRQMLANLPAGCLQHNKISALCDIMDKNRIVKYETLQKCERVILIMLAKPHKKNAQQQQQPEESVASPSGLRQPETICLAEADTTEADLHPCSIRSPSPSSMCSSNASGLGERYDREKPSIYASAGETIDKERAPKLLDVLPIVDTSQPPISAEVLELLKQETSVRSAGGQHAEEADAADVGAAAFDSMHEAGPGFRSKVSLVPTPFNKKSRKNSSSSSSVPASDAVGVVKSETVKANTTVNANTKVEKIIDGDSVFGNLLSSLDEKLIVDEKKRRDSKDGSEPARRPSDSKSRERQRKEFKYRIKRKESEVAKQLAEGAAAEVIEQTKQKLKHYKKQLERITRREHHEHKARKERKREEQQQRSKSSDRAKRDPPPPHAKRIPTKEECEKKADCHTVETKPFESVFSPEPVFSPNVDDGGGFDNKTPNSSEEGNDSPFMLSKIQTHASYLSLPNSDKPYSPLEPPSTPKPCFDDIRTPADPFSTFIPKPSPHDHSETHIPYEHAKNQRLSLHNNNAHNPNSNAEPWLDPPHRPTDDFGWCPSPSPSHQAQSQAFDPFAPVPPAPATHFEPERAPSRPQRWHPYQPRSRYPRWQPPPHAVRRGFRPPPPARLRPHFDEHFKPFAPIGNEYDLSRMKPQDFYQPPSTVPNNYRQWREQKQRDEERKRMMALNEQMEFKRIRQKEHEEKEALILKKHELEQLAEQVAINVVASSRSATAEEGAVEEEGIQEEPNTADAVIHIVEDDAEAASKTEVTCVTDVVGDHDVVAAVPQSEEKVAEVERKETAAADPEKLLMMLSEAKQKKSEDGGTYLPAHVLALVESLLKKGSKPDDGDVSAGGAATTKTDSSKDTIPTTSTADPEAQAKPPTDVDFESDSDATPLQYVHNLRRRTKKINYNEVKIVSELDETRKRPDSVLDGSVCSSFDAGDTSTLDQNENDDGAALVVDDVQNETSDVAVTLPSRKRKRKRKRKRRGGMKILSDVSSRDSSVEAPPQSVVAASVERKLSVDSHSSSQPDAMALLPNCKVVLQKLDVTLPIRPRLARASKKGVSYEFISHKTEDQSEDELAIEIDAPSPIVDAQVRSARLQQTIDEVARGPGILEEEEDHSMDDRPVKKEKNEHVDALIAPAPKITLRPIADLLSLPRTYAPGTHIDPDKNYYLKTEANNCMLCESVGSMAQIVLHYMTDHTQDEVLISRLSPIGSQEAFQEAIMNDYASMEEQHDTHEGDARKPCKLDYRCRFCSHDLHNELTATFFDHVSGHTGEARYHCTMCDFKHYKKLAVKTHMNRVHRRAQEPRIDDVPSASGGMLFGHICSECNYLQVRKDSVQRHIDRYHNRETTYVYVINMSLPTLQRRGAPLPRTILHTDPLAGELMTPDQSNSPAPLSTTPASTLVADTELILPRTRSSQRLLKLKQADADKTDAKPTTSRAPRIGTNVDIVDFDLHELLEPQTSAQRAPPQLKSAFVCENLDEMLRTRQVEAPTIIAPTPKRSSFLDDLKKRLDEHSDNVGEEGSQLPLTLQPPIDVEVACTADMDVKDVALLGLTKHRHQATSSTSTAVLQTDNDDDEVQVASQSTKAKASRKLLSVSIVDALLGSTSESVMYVCRKPACIFQTSARHVLAAHCNYTHPNDTDPLMCNVCDLHANPMPMIDIFEHLCKHVDDCLAAETPEASSSPSPLTTASSSPRFSFRIEKIESLAVADTVTEHADAAAEGSRNIVCKLVAMNDADLERARKTPEVLAKWIADDELRYLFKCPQPDCDFVCQSDTFFDQHLAKHAFENTLVPCLYCNFKMREEYVKMHLLMRHARSKFGCGYCLYRALKRLYVTIHHKAEHPEKMLNIHHNVLTNTSMRFRPPILPPMKNLVKCYNCTCGKKFVLTKNFECHLKNAPECRSLLKCSACQWPASSIDALILHARWHSVYEYMCRYCDYGDTSSSNVVQHIALQHPFHDVLIIVRLPKDANVKFVPSEVEDASVYDNLRLLTETQVKMSVDSVTAPQPDNGPGAGDDDGSTSSNADQQLPPDQLFQCSQCARLLDGSAAFLAHLSTCTFNTALAKPYECRHCKRSYKHARDLVDHMRVHGVRNVSCGLCGHKEGHQALMRKHIKNVHKLSNIQILPMNPAKTNIDVDEFIAKPAIGQTPKQQQLATSSETPDESRMTTAVASVASTTTTTSTDGEEPQTIFKPNDIRKLPTMPIFKFVARCSDCDYATKVRSNFVRHIGMHATGKIDLSQPVAEPVNPVPCLDKNELMFDKMTNLAASSHEGGRMTGARPASAAVVTTTEIVEELKISESKPTTTITTAEDANMPQYIADNKRYVCGATGCNYLCLEEQNLRHHLQALHDNEQNYSCVHCKEDLTAAGKSFIDIDAIVTHLRLHESSLFKCAHCEFINNSKTSVERHCTDKHADKVLKVVTLRVNQTSDAGDDPDSSPQPKKKRVWRCGVCSCRKVTESEIRVHVSEKHSLHTQFKCTYCQFKEDSRDLIDAHFASAHPGLASDIIVGYFKEEAVSKEKDESKVTPTVSAGEPIEGFDTTPLWVKNRVSNVKHIRGILLDENESSSVRKAKGVPGQSGKRRSHVSDGPPPLIPITPPPPAIGALVKVESGSMREDASVIEILDDADTDMVDASGEQESDEINPTLAKLSNLPISVLQSSSYMSTYGPLGKPNGTCYACPLCDVNDVSDEEVFQHHLCEELHYNRFQCMLCAAQTTTFKRMKEHYTDKHLTLCDSDSVKTLQANASIDLWIRKVRTLQTRLIRHNREQQHQKALQQDGPQRKPVPYFMCGHCHYTVMSQNELLAHSGAAHPRKEIRIQRYYK